MNSTTICEILLVAVQLLIFSSEVQVQYLDFRLRRKTANLARQNRNDIQSTAESIKGGVARKFDVILKPKNVCPPTETKKIIV